MTKTIPLSLHTRRVVGVLAIQLVLDHVGRPTPDQAVAIAFDLLGYPEDNPDTHGIRALVLADVQKQFPTRSLQVAA
jgi:hypothetical protein